MFTNVHEHSCTFTNIYVRSRTFTNIRSSFYWNDTQVSMVASVHNKGRLNIYKFPLSVETEQQPWCSFLSYYYAYGAAADFHDSKAADFHDCKAADFHDSEATAASPFCLRFGGRDGCRSVWFRSSEWIRRSANNSFFGCVLRDYTPLCRLVGRLVGQSPFYFFGVF